MTNIITVEVVPACVLWSPLKKVDTVIPRRNLEIATPRAVIPVTKHFYHLLLLLGAFVGALARMSFSFPQVSEKAFR